MRLNYFLLKCQRQVGKSIQTRQHNNDLCHHIALKRFASDRRMEEPTTMYMSPIPLNQCLSLRLSEANLFRAIWWHKSLLCCLVWILSIKKCLLSLLLTQMSYCSRVTVCPKEEVKSPLFFVSVVSPSSNYTRAAKYDTTKCIHVTVKYIVMQYNIICISVIY
jgi:hypothetical protein